MERVRASTGFAIEAVEPTAVTPPPTAEELRLLREEVDPHRYLLGRC
jgi:glutaconate CoA-transferase subunit B